MFLSELENGKRRDSADNLLDMQKQIVAHRSSRETEGLECVDWRKFYEAVREVLKHE